MRFCLRLTRCPRRADNRPRRLTAVPDDGGRDVLSLVGRTASATRSRNRRSYTRLAPRTPTQNETRTGTATAGRPRSRCRPRNSPRTADTCNRALPHSPRSARSTNTTTRSRDSKRPRRTLSTWRHSVSIERSAGRRLREFALCSVHDDIRY